MRYLMNMTGVNSYHKPTPQRSIKSILYSFAISTSFLTFLFASCANPGDTKKNPGEPTDVVAKKTDKLNRQILWDKDCSYSLCEINGWKAQSDAASRNNSGILVVYTPDRNISHIKPVGVYSRVIFKKEYDNVTINGFLKGENETALKNGEAITDGESIKTDDNKIAIVKKYFNKVSGESYAIAYIDELVHIIMVVFTTKDFNDYNKFYTAFEEIVGSYQYLGMVVIDMNKK